MNSNSFLERTALIDAVLEVLNQGETLLCEIDQDQFVRRLPVAFNASIGGHYRHCIDHFRALLDAATSRDLNYDHRERGTLIESDRFAALNATRNLRGAYERLSTGCLERPLHVTCKTSYAVTASQSSSSTVGREIMYVVAHAVHHFALIGIMGAVWGLKLPQGFGVAPSTVQHQADLAKTDRA